MMKKQAVIFVNPYIETEAEKFQPRRIKEELEALGVRTDILPNLFLAHVGREGIAAELAKKYDFGVYLDKDKYAARLLEGAGMRLFNRAEAIETCDDKLLTHIALAGKVPMPKTLPAPLCYKSARASEERAAEIIETIGLPVVVKECFGSFGKQVYLAMSADELEHYISALKEKPHLYQEFIAESAGKDLRVITVGGEPVAAMKRTSAGDFRSNLACGGKGEKVIPDREAVALCRRISEVLDLDYCGIDLLFGREGMLVCEVNSNAFFGGIERVTGVNVARAYSEHIVKKIYGFEQKNVQ